MKCHRCRIQRRANTANGDNATVVLLECCDSLGLSSPIMTTANQQSTIMKRRMTPFCENGADVGLSFVFCCFLH